MRRAVVLCVVLVALLTIPVYAQQAAKEAEIKRDVPYATMLRTMPGLTRDQYNAAVRELAKRPTFPSFPARMSPPSLAGADGTYLGVLSNNRYDPNSVSNPYGRYGSRYSPTTINNPYGKYGSRYSSQSATNPYTHEAPMIVNPYLGRLSANPYAPDSTSNRFGPYGSPFSPTSITNPYSTYGSSLSPFSVTNPYGLSPIWPCPRPPC